MSDLGQRLQRLSPAARRLLAAKLRAGKEQQREDAAAPGVLALFGEWVRRTPEAIALADGQRSLGYAGLDAHAAALAARLLAAGAGPGRPVAFCLQRSLESVVVMLAALTCGAAYVPLDPAHPAARLAFILRDTAAAVLVAAREVDVAALGYAGPVLDAGFLDTDEPGAGETPELPEPDADALAYVMYTSGSTGTPKGVCIGQRGITRLVWRSDYIEFRSTDRVAHASNPAFDAATFEVWGTLLNGARLEIVPTDSLLSARALGEEIRRRELSVLFLTTALFNQLALDEPGLFVGLRCLVFGGEAASLAAVRAVVAHGKPAQLINGYGPTENTTFTTSYEAGEEMLAPHWRSVPIGRPIRGSYVRVLDARGQPVGPSGTGELYAGGEGLARGYLNRPDLDRQAFVPDPLADGARLYRTGDLVREREDGVLEYLGRNDDQLKIRGFRIEPAEVQAAIERCPGVRRAVVLARETGSGGKSLLACVEAAAGGPADHDALRAELEGVLPAYMVPTQWLSVAEWPLTGNGKIDRAVLLQRAERERVTGVTPGEALAEGDTDTERWLLALVSGLLDGARVHPGDDFFDAGGHSLLATRLAWRVEKQLGVRLPVREIFDHPVLGDLARRIDALPRTDGRVREHDEAPRESDAPLSPMQQRLWFLEQLQPGSPLYHIHQVLRLQGPLDVTALERALDLLVERHEALGTRIVRRGETARQQALPHTALRLTVVDLSGLPATEIEAALQRRYDALSTPAFDFAREPLFRVELIRLGPEEHALSWVMHHIVSDGWSMKLFREELAQAYRCLRRGEHPAFPALPMRYSDYARRCTGPEKQHEYAAQLAYWKNALAGMPVLDLPTDFPRPAWQDFSAGECVRALDAALMERVNGFCRGHGVTLFMLLLAVLQLLLGRWSRQEDIAVGVPVAGRNRVETEALIGFFVNTLVLRGGLSGNPSFAEFLTRVRGVALDAFGNQDLPFERLVEELHPARDPGRNPVVDVMLNVLPEQRELDFAGLNATLLMREAVAAKFMMTLYAVVRAEDCELRLVYQSALFSHHTMQSFLDEFVALLEQVLEDPARRLEDYSLVTRPAAALLPDPHEPIAEPRYPSVLGRFLRCADTAPAHAAVLEPHGTLGYGELADSARALAHWLQRDGTRTGEVIAVSGEAGTGVVVAILGVLLAGAVVLPLDTRLPPLRKRLMLEQAGATRLLLAGGEEEQREASAWADGVRVHGIDAVSGLPASVRTGDGASFRFEAPAPDALAYVFFTSGSTGVPKGVLGCHKGLDHFIDWQIRQFGIGPADRVAQLTTLSFDVLLRDLFLPLASGATLCIPTAAQALAPLRWLEQTGITVLHIVPTRANGWLAELPPDVGLEQLRWTFFAGEPLSRTLVEKWRGAFPRSGRLVNLYGPTETTMVKSFYEVPPAPAELVMPVGRPLPQTQLLVLRDGARLCGVGERGEIAIRTPYRTLGYCNAPAETSARFVRNPFRGDERDVIYLTGDCGAYRADGTVMMLGRLDDQVKIRGVRVEPAEVAAVLAGVDGVAACHVGVAADAQGEPQLAAWVVADAPVPPDAARLREALAHRLPSALVPTAWAFLDALPRLPNGKVDRKALPAPGITQDRSHVAPSGEIEEPLAAIWSALLGVERVGAADDFFLLGGHSLLATQLVLRVNERFGVDLPLRAVFEHPTLAGMAREIGRQEAPVVPAAGALARHAAQVRQYPLSSTQQRVWFLAHLDPGSAAYHMRQLWRLRGAFDADALVVALNQVVRRHEALRTAIVVTDGVPMQRVAPGLDVALREHALHGTDGVQSDELERRLREEHREPFDLATPPLLRANLYRLAPQEHVLSLTLHHLVGDGWSTGLLNRELSHFYAGALGLAQAPLPEPAAQFGDFALWQRQLLDERYLGAELRWWQDYLQDSAALELAGDRPRPPASSGRGGTCRRTLPARLSRDFRDFCQRRGSTLFMGLLAAFNILAYRYTGQQDYVVGTPIAGRNRLSDESVVGYYANTLLLRNRVSGQSTIATLMDAARENLLDVFEHQQMPFEKLVEALAPARELSRNPLFQVMFSLQNAPSRPLELAGLKVEPMELADETTKFDLSFALTEEPEGLCVRLSYSTDLFDAPTMSRMAAHYERLLEEMLRGPDRPVASLRMLGDAEAARILEEWNDTARDFGPARLAHQLFEDQAACDPDAAALLWGTQTLTYAQLNERANRLAHALIARGVTAETPVGICLERSPDMVVAMLAVMKAGGAYVPLDPSYPAERLAFMLADSGTRIVIGNALPRESLAAVDDVSVLDLERLRATEFPAHPAVNPARTVSPSQLAYVIYTSGSTGRPKGVMVEHGSVEAFLRAIPDYFSAAELAVVLASSTINFDGALLELFGTLARGGCLVLVRDVLQLAEEPVRAAGITLIHSVPSALRELLTLGAIPASVQVVCSGGEPLSAALADALLEQTRIARLVDVYGPTEDTVYSTVAERERGTIATVGRPIANTRAYILDADGNPVPVGVPGELYLSGRGLARGYLNRPELTRDRFVEIDPCGSGRRRSYRTGDRARYLPDGRIVLLGRLDHQVKLRGYRVETAEIERALLSHPQVRSAIVADRRGPDGDTALIAYVESGGHSLQPDALRHHLSRWLPGYMIPSRFVFLSRFPLLPNGKIDRARLPEPAERESGADDGVLQSRTEQILAAIWRELLDIGSVGRRSDFFDLGGHSLLAMRMVGRVERDLGTRIPVATVFENPSLAELALCIDLHGACGDGQRAAPGDAFEIDEI